MAFCPLPRLRCLRTEPKRCAVHMRATSSFANALNHRQVVSCRGASRGVVGSGPVTFAVLPTSRCTLLTHSGRHPCTWVKRTAVTLKTKRKLPTDHSETHHGDHETACDHGPPCLSSAVPPPLACWQCGLCEQSTVPNAVPPVRKPRSRVSLDRAATRTEHKTSSKIDPLPTPPPFCVQCGALQPFHSSNNHFQLFGM